MMGDFTPFRERNPVTIGAAGLLTIAILLLIAFNAGSMPLIGGGDVYYAHFADSSGLRPNDEVRIAGVRVGKVTDVSLDGDKVRVKFQIKTDSPFGTATGAEIKVKTLLGAMFLSLDPAGPGQFPKNGVIPVDRTRSAYDVVDAFTGLAERAEAIDIKQVRQALNVVADTMSGTPEGLRATLRGLSDLSENVAARDQELNTLLANLKKVSTVLSERDDDLVALMKDTDVLLRALVDRREAIHRLLVSTDRFSRDVSATIDDVGDDLRPALRSLKGVLDMLEKNETDVDNALRLLGPFYRVFANVLGTGPWFDNWLANLPPTPSVGLGR